VPQKLVCLNCQRGIRGEINDLYCVLNDLYCFQGYWLPSLQNLQNIHTSDLRTRVLFFNFSCERIFITYQSCMFQWLFHSGPVEQDIKGITIRISEVIME
jgi:hypothetical protein